jgi:hypothetical protein
MKNKLQDVLMTISAFGLVILLVVSFGVIGAKIVFKSDTELVPEYTYGSIEVVVEPGDTLWSIARAWLPDEDPRVVVGTIRELNQLSSADIYPGQVLSIYQKTNIQPLQVASGTRL